MHPAHATTLSGRGSRSVGYCVIITWHQDLSNWYHSKCFWHQCLYHSNISKPLNCNHTHEQMLFKFIDRLITNTWGFFGDIPWCLKAIYHNKLKSTVIHLQTIHNFETSEKHKYVQHVIYSEDTAAFSMIILAVHSAVHLQPLALGSCKIMPI